MTLRIGLQASLELTVSDSDTAIAWRSGNVPVLGTPRLAALFEEATMAALADHLEPGKTTVGMRIHLDHFAPSAVGDQIVASAEVEQIEGRRITFNAQAVCGSRCIDGEPGSVIGSAVIVRVVVDVERFLQRLK
ncbi:MAG: thioesterase [Acidimicrobiales bacterium]|nr:thioesterase [Acidimicrobiales bacterium]